MVKEGMRTAQFSWLIWSRMRSGQIRWAVPTNMLATRSSVLRVRKALRGGEMRSATWKTSTGWMSSSFSFSRRCIVSLATGAMMKIVMIMARPLITICGGICCTPSAFLTSMMTTTIFT